MYKKFDRQAASIITKLRNYVAKHGYCENLGQTELVGYRDKVNASPLSYPEKWQLTDMLSKAIDSI